MSRKAPRALNKGEKFTCEATVGEDLYVGMKWGAGWCAINDLDLSAIEYGKDDTKGRTCFFGAKDAIPGIKHTGDNTTGEGEGDDEALKVEFKDLNSGAEAIFFSVTNFGMFTPCSLCCLPPPCLASNLFCASPMSLSISGMVNGDKQTFARFDLSSVSCLDRCLSNSIIVGALRRTPPNETGSNGWEFVALGDTLTTCTCCCMFVSESKLRSYGWIHHDAPAVEAVNV